MAEPIDYKAVLEDLKARRTRLDEVIAAVEGIVGETGALGALLSPSKSAAIAPDMFVGMNIVQAAEKYLQTVGRPARPLDEVANALNQGGLHVTQGSVSTILRRSENNDSPVVRVGRGLWGLTSWYPNRPRRVRVSDEAS